MKGINDEGLCVYGIYINLDLEEYINWNNLLWICVEWNLCSMNFGISLFRICFWFYFIICYVLVGVF